MHEILRDSHRFGFFGGGLHYFYSLYPENKDVIHISIYTVHKYVSTLKIKVWFYGISVLMDHDKEKWRNFYNSFLLVCCSAFIIWIVLHLYHLN